MSDYISKALANLGNFRVITAQEYALEGEPDGISGALLLCLGLRESGLKNINNPAESDHGCFQISETYHWDWLTSQPGCPAGTWQAVKGHTAAEDGYCPRYTPALEYAVRLLHGAQDFAISKGIGNLRGETDVVRFAVAAYNAGAGGALRGYREGDVDKYTTGGDYSAWVLARRKTVNEWLGQHANWRPR